MTVIQKNTQLIFTRKDRKNRGNIARILLYTLVGSKQLRSKHKSGTILLLESARD